MQEATPTRLLSDSPFDHEAEAPPRGARKNTIALQLAVLLVGASIYSTHTAVESPTISTIGLIICFGTLTALLVSGLISPVVPLVRQLRGLLRQRGLAAVKVLAGGAALKQCSAEALNVDFVAGDAFECARYLEALKAGRP